MHPAFSYKKSVINAQTQHQEIIQYPFWMSYFFNLSASFDDITGSDFAWTAFLSNQKFSLCTLKQEEDYLHLICIQPLINFYK